MSPSQKKQKERLLIVSDNFLPRWDGISRFLLEITPYLKEKYDITIIAPDFREQANGTYRRHPHFTGVTIKYVPLMSLRFGDYTPARLSSLLIEKHVKEADIIWAQILGPIGSLGINAASRYKKRVFLYVHSIESELFSFSLKRFKPLVKHVTIHFMKRYYHKVNSLLVPYKNIVKRLKPILPSIRKVPINVVPLGVNAEYFSPAASSASYKKKLGIPSDYFVFGYAGRIAREKNLMDLYAAFQRLRKIYPKIALLVVGDGINYKRFQKKYNVYKFPSTSKIRDYYRAMDTYVLPSYTETTCLTVLESMSCGIPVIASSVGMIPEYIESGTNGLILTRNTKNILFRDMKRMYEDNQFRNKIAQNARNTVISHFRWDHTAQRLVDIFEGKHVPQQTTQTTKKTKRLPSIRRKKKAAKETDAPKK
jgi:glycosyltransferase involved in cell wall biosynthesis